MRHLYGLKLERIQQAHDQLVRGYDDNTHPFWLHIDGDKLEKCATILESITEAMEAETDETI